VNRIHSHIKKDVSSDQESWSKEIDNLLYNFGNWLTEEDEFSDTIISSRVRLARNLKGYSFPHKATADELENVIEKVTHACSRCTSLKAPNYVAINELSEWDCKYFVERRLASPGLINKKVPSMLVIGHGENLSIMVNEEDHLRVQCIEAGLGIDTAWNKISNMDDELEGYLNFCYSKRFGYLTACPTNLGTGMRVSIFVHLPALALKNEIDSVLKELPMAEIAVRGFYGEGTESIGDIYQVSNQLTLGRTESNAIDRMMVTSKKLIDLERSARKRLLIEDKIKLEDAVYRALAILQNARIVSSLEAMRLLSTVRLGREAGLVTSVSRLAINQLIMLVQPAHLQKVFSKQLTVAERDIKRAEFIKQNLQV